MVDLMSAFLSLAFMPLFLYFDGYLWSSVAARALNEMV